MSNVTDSVEGYIAERTTAVQKILQFLRALVLKTLANSTEGMKWGAPVFFDQSGSAVIYLYGGKDHVNLGFINGIGLNDPKNLLEGSGKAGRHVTIYPDKPVAKKDLLALIKQCS